MCFRFVDFSIHVFLKYCGVRDLPFSRRKGTFALGSPRRIYAAFGPIVENIACDFKPIRVHKNMVILKSMDE